MTDLRNCHSGDSPINEDQACAVWYAQLTSERATDEDRAAFAAWLAGNPARQAAYRKLTKALGVADKVLSALDAPVALFAEIETEANVLAFPAPVRISPHRKASNRPAALAVAATILITIALGTTWMLRAGPELTAATTSVGTSSTVRLADGSIVTLNTDTALAYNVDGDVRRLRFDRGEAYFEVAPDQRRPFVIDLGKREIRVVGTAFNIRHIDDQIEVAVAEGVVQLSGERSVLSGLRDDQTLLGANMMASYASGQRATVREHVAVLNETAWRRGQLIYKAESLDDVVADLQRYFTTPMVVRAGATAELKISAVINLTDQQTVLNTLAQQLPLAITHDGNGTIEISLRP